MRSRHIVIFTAAVSLGACGGSQTQPQSNVSEPSLYTPKKRANSGASDATDAADDIDGKPFDDEAGNVVIKRGARKASECHRHVNDMPSGEGEVEIIFDGTKGKVVEVKPGYGWEDVSKQALRCLQNSWLGEYVPPFDGTKTIKHSLNLPSSKGKKGK